MAKEEFYDEVSSTAASRPKPNQVVNEDQIVEQQPVKQPQLFFGGTPPKKNASRPSGMVQLDKNGNEIKKQSVGFGTDITSDPNFIAAFGSDNEAVNALVSGKTDRHAVTITNVEHGKPVSEGSANVGSGNFEGSSK